MPEASGGFYETVKGRGTKVYSTVARLAGTWRATAKLKSHPLLNTCVRQTGAAYYCSLIYAETLLENVLEEDAWGGGVVSTADRKVLKAIAALNDRDNPFKDRCVFAVACPVLALLKKEDRYQPPTPLI